jgi:hypothetical protein
VAKFHMLWHLNLTAPWPIEPQKYLEQQEKLWAVMDDLMKKGLVKEYGIFPDGTSGYVIGEGDVLDVYKSVIMFIPYVSSEVHDVISYEKQKEITRALCKAQIAATKK